LFSVEGKTYLELGVNLGARLGERIKRAHAARREWVDKLTGFMNADRKARRDPFVRALAESFPHLLEELEGLAEGAGIAFDRMLAVNLNPELSALMKSVTHEDDCTGAAVLAGGKVWLGHNEDGSCSYLDSMSLLEVSWPSGARSLCYCYPGYWPGNGPSVSSRGLCQTVNYIGAVSVKPGVPRYALDRAILEAGDLEEAIALACHPKRAYSQHHFLMSAEEGRIVSVETGPDAASVIEVQGIFVHANHYVHERMKEVPQFPADQGGSRTRQQAAQEWAEKFPDPAAVGEDDLLSMLSSHLHRPHSICRHPAPELTGCTLGAMMVKGLEREVRFFEGPPCRGRERKPAWPCPARPEMKSPADGG